MTYERAKELETIGIKWSMECTPSNLSWDDRVAELREYKSQYQNVDVPWSYGALGIFVRKHRHNYMLLCEGKTLRGMTYA